MRLQQFTMAPNLGLIGNCKILTGEPSRTPALDAIARLHHPAANRLSATLRSCPSSPAETGLSSLHSRSLCTLSRLDRLCSYPTGIISCDKLRLAVTAVQHCVTDRLACSSTA